jgi:hypothetical protein
MWHHILLAGSKPGTVHNNNRCCGGLISLKLSPDSDPGFFMIELHFKKKLFTENFMEYSREDFRVAKKNSNILNAFIFNENIQHNKT